MTTPAAVAMRIQTSTRAKARARRRGHWLERGLPLSAQVSRPFRRAALGLASGSARQAGSWQINERIEAGPAGATGLRLA